MGFDLDGVIRAAVLTERERCAKLVEVTEIPCTGHPQIDAPTISDARWVIAAAIRADPEADNGD